MRDTGAISAVASRTEPAEPVRFAAFARFFKGVHGDRCGGDGVPAPAGGGVPPDPNLRSAREVPLHLHFAVLSPLLLAYLFYIRHWLGKTDVSRTPSPTETCRFAGAVSSGSLAADTHLPGSGLSLTIAILWSHSTCFRKLA